LSEVTRPAACAVPGRERIERDMGLKTAGYLKKVGWAIPWLTRYPLWRAHEVIRRVTEAEGPRHLILVIANHFEPAWSTEGFGLDWSAQLARLDRWYKQSAALGNEFRDRDGIPFRHTNYYPAEQYHPRLLDRLAEMQADELGEVEIHLHHGLERPDTEANLRRTLASFRDTLANEHGLLSRQEGDDKPMYSFVHGNFALANSAGGHFCGVDSEMKVLAETGCYSDLTLPSWPDRTQVARINAIYQCGRPLDRRSPHRAGPGLRAGGGVKLPIILTGPLVFDWQRRVRGLPIPRVDSGCLQASYPPTLGRLFRWMGANICVEGQPEWVFVKLYCHGFFPFDQPALLGEPMRRFLGDLLELTGRNKEFTVRFATAREAFNLAMAAVDGHRGDPSMYRDYRLRPIQRMTDGKGNLRQKAASHK
jgi:hypothetical protein